MCTKEYIQGGSTSRLEASTSVQRHLIPFRGNTSIQRHPLKTFKINVFLVSTSGSPSYFALGCSELLACRYSAEHGVTFDPGLHFMSQRPPPHGVPEAGASFCVGVFRVYLPNKSSVEVRVAGLEKCRALTLAAFVLLTSLQLIQSF